MQQLVVVDNPRLAQAFVDYMKTQSIRCQLAPVEQGFTIWLVDEQHLAHVQRELKDFLANPLAKKYQAASWEVGDEHNIHFEYGSSSELIKRQFMAHSGPLTLAVILVTTIIYVAGLMGASNDIFAALRFPDTLSQLASAPWRAFTPILLHFSILHILFNLLWWWEFGGVIERHLGTGKLLILTVVAAVIPNIAQFWVDGPMFGGLSGVVYALLGYLWWTSWLRPHVGLHINRAIVGFMLIWLVLGFANVIGPATANLAHLFGLFVGCVQAAFDRVTDKDIS
ncbi:rhomboid family intramembrane serine protease GlpG [Celerinatantimonas yamalensis]|uniref:Rhomboid family intramembrane serine protease GlpG n=1 Tax=Celerinatantimonas yamalensis TaxID=559956 RepID=A0ABW9G9S8_9GAMM